MNTIRGLFGCEPDKFSTNVLNINPGVVWDFYGVNSFEFPTQVSLDFTTVGLGGYDISGGPADNTNLCVYLIANSSTGAYGFIGSSSIYQGGVVVPSGFTIMRKLPWSVMYNSSWGGIPNFHLTHWPMPMITFTDSENSGLWCGLSGGVSTSWADIDLSSWIPDTARFAHLMVGMQYVSGVGSGYLRSYGAQATGILVGSCNSSSVYNMLQLGIRTDSSRKIQYKTNTTGVKMSVYVLGYSMTDPS